VITKVFVGEKMKLVVMIPAYNEEKSLGGVIAEIPPGIEGISEIEILVIDDGSTDGTVKEAEKAGADKVISHSGNMGLGVTFKDGLDMALDMGADIMVNIDADGQYNAYEIPVLVRPIVEQKADIVLGWRNINALDFMPRGKKLGNKLATWATRISAGFPVKDAQSGYRAFSRDAALKMNLSGKYTYVQETLMQAKYKGLWVEQVPIEFRARRGESRLISGIFNYALKAGRTILSTLRDYRPLWLFCSIGGLITAAGLGFAAGVLNHYLRTGFVSPHIPSAIAASLLIIVGLGVMVFGVIADLFKKQRLLEEEILYQLKKSSTGSDISKDVSVS